MLQDVRFTDEAVTVNREPGESYHRRNYDLCRGINITNLSCALNDMIEAGLPKEQAECFKTAAYALLQLMRTENNRLYAAALSNPSTGG